MKRLILMRHAKSDWSHDREDHDRSLNTRGQRSAKAMGDWLRASDTLPDEVLCSSATRTRETLHGLALNAPPTRFEHRLYHAAPDTILSLLKDARGQTVLLLGHNPGIGLCAAALVGTAPDHPRFRDYPTCATLIADFDIADWDDLIPGRGKVVDFRVPREFTD